ncbi:RNA polymerase sigma factor [Sinomicrobium weinanense]|uniref:RNA polymerase sigma-70 factor n=1 Tax=Sinomicrobium weinanense TaxID=2842200 RepID=A0A926JQN2_9FLAO|nr:RNA polymerase sigma-70 factor [Sinomicrobium weinanense]MBC9795707.1 RNA polymerase sigma-70 factor [Sinomicrobium weinanense]MBU3125270.1 RNA polymerase sigma-70 factor [Sinomicrobium weinanense]
MNNETGIVDKLRKGDHAIFKIVFEEFYPSVVAYVLTLTADDAKAKDIAQSSFISLWEKRKKLREKSSLRPYLFKIAYHLYINQYHKEKFRKKVLEEFKYDALQKIIPKEEDPDDDRQKRLGEIIDALPVKCREILMLHKKEGKKYKDIAALLNISVKTVESQMRIAYIKIREGFEAGKK